MMLRKTRGDLGNFKLFQVFKPNIYRTKDLHSAAETNEQQFLAVIHQIHAELVREEV